MSKFRVKLKLQGLEIEVEGSRDDIPLITANIGQQFAGFLQPAAEIVEGDVSAKARALGEAAIPPSTDGKRKGGRRRRSTTATPASAGASSTSEQSLIWRHDPSKWGVPRQEWSSGNKILYFMYVAKNETGQSDLTAPAITSTYNAMFRQSGLLNPRNMVRDLGRLKSRGGLVSDDPSQTPTVWFLTQNGEPLAQRLVEEALGRAPATVATADIGDGETN